MEKRVEVKVLYETVMWRQYCLLPTSENAPAHVHEVTQTRFAQDKTVPVYPAPQKWLDEVVGCVERMIDEANAADPEIVR